jgi:cell division protein FtsZ
MVMPGLINLDFADIRAVMSEMGKAMMGTGEATGDNRAIAAAEAAISNPLLDEISMKGAKGVLINITGGMDMTLFEVDEAANRIRDEVDPDANIIFGSTFDQSLEGKIRISVVATGIDAQAQAHPRPNAYGNLSLVPRTVQVATPAADGGERIVARAETSYAPAAAAPMTAHAVAPQARPAGFGMVTTPKVAQPTMSAAQPAAQPMTHPTMGATALQAQPARQPILKDEMAALDRLVSRQPERVERPIDDRPFIAPPASEPAMRAQPQVAEPVVPQARMQQPAPQMPQPQMTASAPSLQMPSPQAPVAQPPALTVDPPHVEQRRRAPSLFEKVTSRLTGQQAPKQPPAQQTPRPQAERKQEPVMTQPQLQLDPADRMSISRQEEDMLDIPAFLRRQAN